jgi:hypothetical protein
MIAAIHTHLLNSIHSGNFLNLPILWAILLIQDIPEIVCRTGYTSYLSFVLTNQVAWLTTEFNKTTAIAYDFAISGAAVEEAIVWGEIIPGYVEQVDDFLLSTENNTQLTSNPLFSIHLSLIISDLVSWIGINDLVLGRNLTHSMDILFHKAETLYSHGARDFVYFNLPPIHRTPAGNILHCPSNYRIIRMV